VFGEKGCSVCVCVCVGGGNCYVSKFWVPVLLRSSVWDNSCREDCPSILTADRFFGVVASCNLNNLTASILLVVSLGCRLMFLWEIL
jgi:hypothetical protein